MITIEEWTLPLHRSMRFETWLNMEPRLLLFCKNEMLQVYLIFIGFVSELKHSFSDWFCSIIAIFDFALFYPLLIHKLPGMYTRIQQLQYVFLICLLRPLLLKMHSLCMHMHMLNQWCMTCDACISLNCLF